MTKFFKITGGAILTLLFQTVFTFVIAMLFGLLLQSSVFKFVLRLIMVLGNEKSTDIFILSISYFAALFLSLLLLSKIFKNHAILYLSHKTAGIILIIVFILFAIINIINKDFSSVIKNLLCAFWSLFYLRDTDQ